MKTRICSKCKIEKNINKFYNDHTNRYAGGHYYYCKKCCNIEQREYRNRRKNMVFALFMNDYRLFKKIYSTLKNRD